MPEACSDYYETENLFMVYRMSHYFHGGDMALTARHKSDWVHPRDDCMLCEMEQKTHWYIETQTFVVAEKLSGGPFVVAKRHTTELTDEEWWRARHVSELMFGEDIELDVRMGMVPDHWHAHIVTDDTDPASLDNE